MRTAISTSERGIKLQTTMLATEARTDSKPPTDEEIATELRARGYPEGVIKRALIKRKLKRIAGESK